MPKSFSNIQEIHDELTDLETRVQSFVQDVDARWDNETDADQASDIHAAIEQAVMAAEPKE